MVVTASQPSSSANSSTPLPLSSCRDHVSGRIESPRVAPHRLGLQPRKSCFKPPERSEQRVPTTTRARIADQALCVVTGAVVEPHPRDHQEWKADREQRKRAAATDRADAADAAAAKASARDSSRRDKRQAGAKKRRTDDDATPDPELERRLDQAKANVAYLLADCRYASRKTRHHHPCTWVKEWSP